MADITLTYKGATIAELSESGTKTIETAGKYCEADIGLAYVKPGGGGGQAMLDAFISNAEIESPFVTDVQTLRASAFNSSQYPLQVVLNNVTSIPSSCFQGSKMTSVKMPNVTALGANAFRDAKIVYAVLPKHTQSSLVDYLFAGNTSLLAADYGPNTTNIGRNYIFQNASSLATVIFRQAGSVVPLSNTNSFNGTPFASGGAGGTIYIPKALYDHLGDNSALDYKAATNWATVDGYGTITWAKIEGSIYETQYADGTPISS